MRCRHTGHTAPSSYVAVHCLNCQGTLCSLDKAVVQLTTLVCCLLRLSDEEWCALRVVMRNINDRRHTQVLKLPIAFISTGNHLLDLAGGLQVTRHLTLHSKEGNYVTTSAAASSIW